MTTYIYTATYTSSGNVLTFASGDTATFLPGSIVASSGGSAIVANGGSVRLSVAGAVAGLYDTIVLGTRNGTDVYGSLQILPGATVQSINTAVEVSATNVTVTNAGTISGIIGISTGFFNTAADGSYYSNSGLIDVLGAGIRLNAADQRVVNSGTIQSVEWSGGGNFMGAYIGSTVGGIIVRGNNAIIGNSGTILSGSIEGYGIAVEGGGARITNSGLIQVASTHALRGAINMYETASDQINTFVNASGGRVVAQQVAVGGGIGIDIVKNHGSITGDIKLFDASDILINSGQIGGDVYLDLLDDTYLAQGAGLVTGTVYGGDGADRLTGGSLGDRLVGDAGADIISGGSGNDELDGGLDADRVMGGDGNDTVIGGAGADFLYGDAGDDVLWGGGDIDRMYGGSGEDTLIGGVARDIMSGGTGADSFVFLSTADSGPGTAGDIIRDFEHGIDTIDLDAVYSGDLSFVGTGPLAGGGTSSVRYFVNPAGHAMVIVDANGDGVEDMRIIVQSTPMLDAGDFQL